MSLELLNQSLDFIRGSRSEEMRRVQPLDPWLPEVRPEGRQTQPEHQVHR